MKHKPKRPQRQIRSTPEETLWDTVESLSKARVKKSVALSVVRDILKEEFGKVRKATVKDALEAIGELSPNNSSPMGFRTEIK